MHAALEARGEDALAAPTSVDLRLDDDLLHVCRRRAVPRVLRKRRVTRALHQDEDVLRARAPASAAAGVSATWNFCVLTPYLAISSLLWYSCRLRWRTCCDAGANTYVDRSITQMARQI